MVDPIKFVVFQLPGPRTTHVRIRSETAGSFPGPMVCSSNSVSTGTWPLHARLSSCAASRSIWTVPIALAIRNRASSRKRSAAGNLPRAAGERA